MTYMHISDEHDIAEAVRKLMAASFDAGLEEGNNDLDERLDKLSSDICDLQDIANERQDRIDYLESLLEESGIDFE